LFEKCTGHIAETQIVKGCQNLDQNALIACLKKTTLLQELDISDMKPKINLATFIDEVPQSLDKLYCDGYNEKDVREMSLVTKNFYLVG